MRLSRLRRVVVVAFACAAAAPAWAQGKAEDEAGDVSEVDKDSSGPLRDRIPPVTGHVLLMNGRFEVSPGLGISIRDAFFTKYVLGASLTYHLSESFGISARGGYALSVISGAAQICDAQSCRQPTVEELTREANRPANKAYGLMSLLAGLDLQWAPIYGKVSLVAERVVHFNMYGMLGPQLVSYGPSNTMTIGGNAGIGFRFFINTWLTVRAELRDVIYYEQGFFLEQGQATGSLRNQLIVDLGLSMFFPTVFQENRR